MGTKGPRHAQQDTVKAILISCVAYVCVTICGCGYTIAGTALSKEYHTIAVPAFKNDTYEQDLQILFNNILVRELEADGRLRVVNDPASADLVLKGSLTHFEPHAISYVTKDNVAQFEITIVASATLEDTRTGKILWQHDDVRGMDSYQTRGGRTREQAIEVATKKLVERLIYESLDTYW
jgi:hypothetical protein